MPFIIAGVVKSMAFSMLGNSGIIEKVVILLLETLAKKTDSDVDDKLVALHKKTSKSPLKVEDVGGLECSKCHY